MPVEGKALHKPIAPLPPGEVERIAAGEVIERPVNVVKELIENSLDAGATSITVDLEDGGKQLVRVGDDGGGIPPSELPLALKPHHTSKISSLDDIYRLESLGFRGEALASIAAVGRLVIESRHGTATAGARLECAGGQQGSVEPCSMSSGTVVEVRELFFNTPVRLKFLRSRQAETGMVAKLMASYALAYTDVRWRLSSSGRTLLEAPGDGNLKSVLADLAGQELTGALCAVNYEFPPLGIRGFISAPHIHRHNRSRQWYFINRRPVNNRVLFRAVDDAVREFISQGKFPACALFIELPPEEIDVNVHPMKTEINFAQPQAVYSLIVTGVRRALGAAAASRQRRLTRGLSAVITPTKEGPPASPPVSPALELDDPGLDENAPPGRRIIPLYRQDQPIPIHRDESGADSAREIDFPRPQISGTAGHGQAPGKQEAGQENLAGPGDVSVFQVAGSYLAVITPDSLYLVDQHAAHERILFESIYEGFSEEGVSRSGRQKLLFELLVDLSPDELETAGGYIQALSRLGFSCETAGRQLRVCEVPAPLAGHVTEQLIHGMLEDLGRQEQPAALADRAKEAAASLACRAAIKANHHLGPADRRQLISQLLARWSSLSCPHGRPTIIELSRRELENLFLR